MAERARRIVASIRFRITAFATLAVLLVLVGTGIALVVAQERVLTENLEEGIDLTVDELAELAATGDLPAVIAGRGDDDTVAQVVTVDGEVLAATSNISGEPAIADPPAAGERSTRTVDLPFDDSRYRLVSRSVVGPLDDVVVVVHVAATIDDIEESTATLEHSLAVIVPLVTALLGALIWWLVGRTLRPVEAIRAEVAEIGGSDLHRRVPEPASGDEIGRLARTMNGMLDRVEDSSHRQQRFVADASHELRSPLTRIRSEIEVDLAHPGTADLAATHRSVLDEAIGLQRLVDDLLHLARSDAGAAVVAVEPVDLDDILLRHARRLRDSERVSVDTSGIGTGRVTGDGAQLSRAIGNVVDNAARHAAGAVTLTLAESDGVVTLAVSDDGPGIPTEQHERVFGRFTRLDDARDTASGGSGLGLAIARDIVERHGGTIAVDAAHSPGARFVITLPAS